MPTNSQGWDSRLPEPAVSRADAVSKWSYLSQDSCGMVPHTESFQESSRQTVKSFEIDARVPSPSYPLEHVYNHPEGVPPIAPIETSQMESSHGDGQQWRHSDDLFGIMPHVSSTAAPYSPLVERYPQSCLSPPTNKICPVIVEPIARRPQTQREPFQCDRKQSDSRYMHGGGDSGNIERSPSSLDMNAEISSFGPSINDDDVSLNQPDDRLDFCDPDLRDSSRSSVDHLTAQLSRRFITPPYSRPDNSVSSSSPSPCSLVALILRCSTCGVKFTGKYRKGNLERHMKNKHRGSEIPCSVEWCNKAFQRRDALLKHERKRHRELGRPTAVCRGGRRRNS